MRTLFAFLLLAAQAFGATYFVCAGGGNWNANGTWCTGSSGSGTHPTSPSLPDSTVDVVAEAGSGNLTQTASSACQSFDTTSGTGNWAGTLALGAFTLAVGGSNPGPGSVALKWNTAVTVTGAYGQVIMFGSTSGMQQTVDFSTKQPSNVTFNGIGGSWKMMSDYVQRTNGGYSGLTLSAGALDTNGKTLTVDGLTATGTSVRSLTLGASVIILAQNVAGNLGLNLADTTNLTVSAGTSVINFTRYANSGPLNIHTTGGPPITLYNLTTVQNTPTWTINLGGTTFNKLILQGASFSMAAATSLSSNVTVTGSLSVLGPNNTETLNSTDGTVRCIQFTGVPTLANSVLTNVVIQAVCSSSKVKHRVIQ